MQNIFITATNTNVGKTYTTIKLLQKFTDMGYKVGAFKPIETGVINIPQDGDLLLKACQKLNPDFKDITLDDICPIQLSLPAAPYIASKNKEIDFNLILQAYKKIKKYCDILLIEGAGGLLVPVTKEFFMIDFIEYFDAKALLVTGDKLGCINDTLLSIEALNSRKLKHTWCVNLQKDNLDFFTITEPFYRSHFESFFILQNDLKSIANSYIDRN
jgi:dethiobiotin synthetase